MELEFGKRPPAVAGAFYPAEPSELNAMIKEFLKRAPKSPFKDVPRAILVPHAGYVYSGQVAAFAYALIRSYHKVLLVGPSHFQYFSGVATDTHTCWITPLGEVPLIDSKKERNQKAHEQEHCLEVQLPFLQTVLSEFSILPLVVGEADPGAVKEEVDQELGDDVLLVISSDLSHYHDYETALALDQHTIQAIQGLDADAVGEACGRVALQAGILIARERNWRVQVLGYQNSGDRGGGKDQVVGYASAAFYAGH